MDFSSLIGLDVEKAKTILAENGYTNVEITLNAEHNELCDSVLVCLAKESNGKVTLVCGEFYLNIKR
jgi:hypothetical protein